MVKKYEITGADELDLAGLRALLENAGRYALMQTRSKHWGEEYPPGKYHMHGQGEIIDRGGAPCLYTTWINGDWHVTSDIKGWCVAPDYPSVWNKPQWMVEAHPDEPASETTWLNVIRIETRNSTYELRYGKS